MKNRLIVNNHSVARSFFIVLFCVLLLNFFIFSIESAGARNQIEELCFENSYFRKVEGVELHYRIWHNTEHQSIGNVLLMHGLGGSTFSWRFVAPHLAENGYLVLAVDLPGFGLSQRKPAVRQSHENRANLVWGLLEDLDIAGPWHLVGHSMGGGVGAVMALQKPFDTVSLILVAGSIGSEGKKIWSLLFQSKLLKNLTGKIIERFFLTRKRIKSFLTSAYGRVPTPEEVEGYYQPLELEDTDLTLISFLKRYQSDVDLTKRLTEITVPTLCLWGREDKWVPISKGEEVIQKIPDSHLVIIDEARHCPMETHPGLFNQNLIDFLSVIKIFEMII
jgi:pimeloyl-ACP methyl ester carboxylesterase